MRPSQTARLIDIERRRTSWRHGFHARVWQLKCGVVMSLLLFLLSRYHLWRNPRPHSHVWIDDVVVQVLESSWADTASIISLYSSGFFGVLLMAFLLCGRPERSTRRHRAGSMSGYHADDSVRHDAESLDSSTIRPVPGSEQAAAAGTGTRTAAGMKRATATAAPLPMPHADPTRPMRTSAALDSFLQQAAAEERRRRARGMTPASGHSGDGGVFTGQPLPPLPAQRASFLGPTEGRPAMSDGTVQVRYHPRSAGRAGAGGVGSRGSGVATSGQGADGTPRGLSERDWETLGILHLDHALTRTREWVSELCRHLITEVDACDRWLTANEASAYDCGHSLKEVLQVPAPAPAPAAAAMPMMGGWGGGLQRQPPLAQVQQQAQPQTISKHQALMEHRALIQRSDHRNFDTVLRLDQRIALEVKLDFTETFPESARLSNAELCARHQYVVQRLRTFAKQRTLASYKHSGGDADTWREGFPCDAHLLLHVVRTNVEGMSSYVRFGYQGTGGGGGGGGVVGGGSGAAANKSQDLAMYVGDTGEPYFYVRYRGPAQDRLYATRPGALSLFEALLIFAALIHVHHDDVYGGIRGTMDLGKVGLTKVLREPKIGAAWTEAL